MMDFVGVEAEFWRLKAAFERGALTEADFRAQLEELMVEDEQGRWWIIGYETGQWYVHDGEQWVQQELPSKDRQAPPSSRRREASLGGAWAKARDRLPLPSNPRLIAVFAVPVLTLLVNLALVNGLYTSYYDKYFTGRYGRPDLVHLLLAAVMPALLPAGLLLFRKFPGILSRCLVFVGAVVTLYWIGAPILISLNGGLSGAAVEIYGPSLIVLLGSVVLSPIYGKVSHDRAKRQADRAID